MTGLEIVGAAAIYVVGCGAFGYLLIAFMAYLNRRAGLESIPMIIGPTIVFWILAVIVGLVLLGRAIG